MPTDNVSVGFVLFVFGYFFVKSIKHPLILLFLAVYIVFGELFRFIKTVLHQFKIDRSRKERMVMLS